MIHKNYETIIKKKLHQFKQSYCEFPQKHLQLKNLMCKTIFRHYFSLSKYSNKSNISSSSESKMDE